MTRLEKFPSSLPPPHAGPKTRAKGRGGEAADKEKVEWGEEFFPFSFFAGFSVSRRASHHDKCCRERIQHAREE